MTDVSQIFTEDLVDELVRRGILDHDHIVDIRATEFGAQHPVRCRPDLLGCPLVLYLHALPAAPRPPGRYRVVGVDTHPSEWEWSEVDE
jgi:hypothetical protein